MPGLADEQLEKEFALGAEKEAAARMVEDRFLASSAFIQPQLEKFLSYYKEYRGILEWKSRQEEEISAKYHFRHTFASIETVVPRLVEAVFGSSPYVTARARRAIPSGDGRMTAEQTYEAVLAWQFKEADVEPRSEEWFRESMIYGTAIRKIVWKRTAPRTILVRKEVMVPPETDAYGVPAGPPTKTTINAPVETVDYDNFEMAPVDLFEFFPDPDATDVDEDHWYIHRSSSTVEELRRQGHDEAVLADLDSGYADANTYVEDRKANADIFQPTMDPRRKNVELLEYWGPSPEDYPLHGIKAGDQAQILIANRRTVVTCRPNPFWHGMVPFVMNRDYVIPHEFYGVGECEIASDISHFINTLANQRIDNVRLALNRMYLVGAVNADSIPYMVSRPGGVIPVTQVGDVRALEQPDVTSSAYTEMEAARFALQNITGVWDNLKGAAPIRDETATGAATRIEAGTFRLKLKVKGIEWRGMRRLVRLVVGLNRQFLNTGTLPNLIGENGTWVDVDLATLNQEYDFDFVGSSQTLGNQQIQLQTLTNNLLPFLSSIPPDRAKVNIVQIAREVLRLSQFKNIDSAVSAPDPPPPAMPGMGPGGPGGPLGASGPGGPPGGPGLPDAERAQIDALVQEAKALGVPTDRAGEYVREKLAGGQPT